MKQHRHAVAQRRQPAWPAASAIVAGLGAVVALAWVLSAPSDIAPGVVLASRPAATWSGAPAIEPPAVAGDAVNAEAACAAPPCAAESGTAAVPVPSMAAAPVAVAEPPAEPDAWALDPHPIGTPAAKFAAAPRLPLANTPWAVADAMTEEEEAPAEEGEGGGHEAD